MIVNKVTHGDEVYLDLTKDTVVKEKLAKDFTAHDKNGLPVVGEMEEGGGGSFVVGSTLYIPAASGSVDGNTLNLT